MTKELLVIPEVEQLPPLQGVCRKKKKHSGRVNRIQSLVLEMKPSWLFPAAESLLRLPESCGCRTLVSDPGNRKVKCTEKGQKVWVQIAMYLGSFPYSLLPHEWHTTPFLTVTHTWHIHLKPSHLFICAASSNVCPGKSTPKLTQVFGVAPLTAPPSKGHLTHPLYFALLLNKKGLLTDNSDCFLLHNPRVHRCYSL